jgi:hypothetical protein
MRPKMENTVSERWLKFLLSELKTIRIVCKKCKTKIEMDIDAVNKKGLNCPCGAMLIDGQAQPDIVTIATLAKDVGILQQSQAFELEFVLPDMSGLGS